MSAPQRASEHGLTVPALAVRDLRKRYGSEEAVRGISFALPPGEIFGLLGPNGAGKSSTINMIAGVARIDTGSVAVFGHDSRRDYRLARRLLGVMHQEIVIDHFLTVGQTLRFHAGYYGYATDQRWRELLIERLGLGPHLHKSMNRLSGGLKRRLMVAKALIHRPPLLILDEPTAGVDVELRRALWEFVREINRSGTTVLLTTHYLEEAETLCARIAIMNHGEIVALAPTAELLARIGDRHLNLLLAVPLAAPPPELQPFAPQLLEQGRRLSLQLPRDCSVSALLHQLEGLGLELIDMEARPPTLEQVFLQLTGTRPAPRESA